MHFSAVLCDIEGTTTSISFVHKSLFDLAKRRLEDFVNAHWGSEELESLKSEITPFTRDSVTRALRDWMAADRKHTGLKTIQGKIWKVSYEAGEIRSHVFPDVPQKFAEWKAAGILIAIFSSGSIQAQQLLFRHTEAGDLTPFISAYFDTTTGPKQQAKSYSRIAEQLHLPASEILFLSDTIAELDAAQVAGMQTIRLLREGAEPGGNHPTATTFHDV